MRSLHAALALGVFLATVGLVLLLVGSPDERPSPTGPVRRSDAPPAPRDAQVSTATPGTPGPPAIPSDLEPDAPMAEGAEGSSLWSDVQVIATTWWVNCRSGPIGRFGASLERLRALAADPATPPEKRRQAEEAIRHLEHMEDDWDVRVCGWISKE